MKKVILISVLILGLALVGSVSFAAKGGSGGINNPPGVPLYVIIEVTWDGDSNSRGDWTVWGPTWDPEVGTDTILASCSNCLDMNNYSFTFHGKTVHFDEVMVPSVRATPQINHVVLKDLDGDGIYTGSLAAGHYFPWAPEPDGSWAVLYFDRIDYEITFDADGDAAGFHYLQYEHKKLR
jgi:hypothetical protein